MTLTKSFEFPPALRHKYERAKRLEILTIIYLISTALVTFLTMGNSQSMKTAWYEDLLSMIPSVSFLITTRIYQKKPNGRFPYGYHRVISIAYLTGSIALLGMGLYLSVDAATTLIKQEHPTIGIVSIFGHQFWLGYLMIVALLWGSVPSFFLGRMKIKIAEQIHDKNLFTDAEMNKADWMTAAAAIAGIIGIGLGLWWADAAAAIIISVDIIRDGFGNVKQAVYDLMDERPDTVEDKRRDPLVDRVKELLDQQQWIERAEIRFREEGHVYFGEAFVIPRHSDQLVQRIEQLTNEVYALNWRIHDFTLMPVSSLPDH